MNQLSNPPAADTAPTELSAADCRGGRSITDCLHNAIWHLHQAVKRNNVMQEATETGSPAWHHHETIDDRLHDALSELGD
jgi:hypothetical protein